ncbi:hypothetical protein ABWH91_08875 [Phycisphaerales bacterium ac7]
MFEPVRVHAVAQAARVIERDESRGEHRVIFELGGRIGDRAIASDATQVSVRRKHVLDDPPCRLLGAIEVPLRRLGIGGDGRGVGEAADHQAVPADDDFVVEPRLFASVADREQPRADSVEPLVELVRAQPHRCRQLVRAIREEQHIDRVVVGVMGVLKVRASIDAENLLRELAVGFVGDGLVDLLLGPDVVQALATVDFRVLALKKGPSSLVISRST